MASGFFSQRFFNRPTISKTHLNSASFYSSFLNPITKVLSFISESNKSGMSTIKLLFRISSPITIFRFIISIIINTIETMFGRWRISDIFKKFLKRLSPLFANFNSSSPISRVSFNGRELTSGNHMLPSSIFFSNLSSKSSSMFIHSMTCSRWHSRLIIPERRWFP